MKRPRRAVAVRAAVAWVVGLLGPVARNGDKAGALRRLIVEEVT